MNTYASTNQQFLRTVAKAITVLVLLCCTASAQTGMEQDRLKAERLKAMAGDWVSSSNTKWAGELPEKITVSNDGDVKCFFNGKDKTEHALLKETKDQGVFFFEYERMNRFHVTMKLDGSFEIALVSKKGDSLYLVKMRGKKQ